MRKAARSYEKTEGVVSRILFAILNGRMRGMETFSRANLIRLVLISIFLTTVDTAQSYYYQRVINVFNEANAFPGSFYRFGFLGYVMYAPIEFAAMFLTLLTLWAWASYVLWYHKNIISKPKMSKPAEF